MKRTWVVTFVLQYEAFSKCLPTDIRIPVPAFNKVIGFVFRQILLSILTAIPPILLLLLFVAVILIEPDASRAMESWTGKTIAAVLLFFIFALSYCYALAKFGLVLPAGIAGYDATFSTAMDRSLGKTGTIFFEIIRGPLVVFVLAYVFVLLGYVVSDLSGLEAADGEMPIWLSSLVSVLNIGFLCWVEVMIAAILSAWFLKTRTISKNSDASVD